MNRKQFKKAMQSGLGRCVYLLNDINQANRMKDIVLWGCLHQLSYDVQSEGTRSWFLYQLITRCKDDDYFLIPLKSLYGKQQDYWVLRQQNELLLYFAMDGNNKAKKMLQHTYQCYYHTLLNTRHFDNQIFNLYESLCIDFVKYSREWKSIFISIVKDMGQIISLHKEYYINFEEFHWYCEFLHGKRKVRNILSACSDEQIQVYYHNLKTSLKPIISESKVWNAKELYKEIDTYPYLRAIGIRLYKENQDVLKEMAALYEQEIDVTKRAKLLTLFSPKTNVNFISIDSVWNDVNSNHEELRETAKEVLSYLKDDRVYQMALCEIKSGNDSIHAFSMLASNYHTEDKVLFMKALMNKKINYQDSSFWHNAGSIVLDMFEDKQITHPPVEALYYIYEHTLCSCCRKYALQILNKRHRLSKEIKYECLYDSNEDIRKLANEWIQKLS